MGHSWHFEGQRQWEWMDNGAKPNGWLEFCSGGILRISFYNGWGTWKRHANGEMMIITFGNWQHLVRLLPETKGQAPTFEVQERIGEGGRAKRKPNGPRTQGRLVLLN